MYISISSSLDEESTSTGFTHSDGRYQCRLNATKHRSRCHGQQSGLPYPPFVEVYQRLRPATQTEHHEALRLDLYWDVEVLDDAIRAKGDTAKGPEKHHGAGKSISRLGAPVGPYLGHKLDTPQDGANGAQYRRADRDRLLGCHG